MAKSNYKVVGELPVAGHGKGETFSAEFLPHEEQALIESGAIAKASSKEKEA